MSEQKRSFVVYEVSVSPRGKPRKTLPLDNFDGKGTSVLRLFASYMRSMPKDKLIQKKDRYFGQPFDEETAGCTYTSKIISGTAGIISEIAKANQTGPGFKREEDDIERITFNVRFVQPPKSHVGFLMIERVSNRSVGQAFRTIFVNILKRRYPEIILTLARTAETDAWKAAEEAGDAVSVRMVKAIHRGIGASALQEFGIGGVTRPVGEYHQVLRFQSEPVSGGSLRKLREYLFPAPPPQGVSVDGGNISMVVADDGGADEDEADELVAEVSYPGGKTQSIRCSGARPPLITYKIDQTDSEDADTAFRRETKSVVESLVENSDSELAEKWDDGEWKNAESLPIWKVDEFYEAADPVV
ncbi:hypothetical protein JOJ86_005931 [Rhodococcus percolatus]|uniref:hypothetical protein n=1 Tax=Rhodococcus opacus TaxID=37919 RepID=UPI0015FD702E|nr:hypothetical protein [Rhodococcus opacus]MBA8964653.1 hypothetical protein [Rhodococcus opacus]MBP2208205.1 hypothetical protein [Rhodococcus opacus]